MLVVAPEQITWRRNDPIANPWAVVRTYMASVGR